MACKPIYNQESIDESLNNTYVESHMDQHKFYMLNHKWSLYYTLQTKNEWHYSHIINYCTIEGMWAALSKIIETYCEDDYCGKNYHCMREGILPMWEDDANKDGTVLKFQIKTGNKLSIIHNFLAFVMSSHSKMDNVINGIYFGIKPSGYLVVGIWLRKRYKSISFVSKMFSDEDEELLEFADNYFLQHNK